jgi:hypothetical protein
MRLENLLRFDYWLDASVVNQPAGRAMWLVVLLGLLGCAVVAVLLARGRIPRDVAVAWCISSALLSLVGLGRLFAIPVLGWRAGWLIAVIVALLPIVQRIAKNVRNDGLISDCLAAMAFAPLDEREHDWHVSTVVLWLGFNLIGTSVIFANINVPAVYAPALLLIILAPVLIVFVVRTIRHSPLELRHLSCLAPLTIVYITALLNLSGLRIEGSLNGVLYLPLSLIVMSAYAFAISCRWSVADERRLEIGDWRFVKWSALALVAGTVIWAIWTALTLRTHGVTGSDPYAYAQMGVDLATRGTVFHAFPLVGLTYDLGVSSFPIVHVGYKIPNDASRMATTVWPPGYAVATALAFFFAGETGLYLITPLLGLISLAVVGWFAYTVSRIAYFVTAEPSDAIRDTRYEIRNTRYVIVAVTVFLTATSYQQVEWQMIPMADIAAQLFSILALTLALRAGGSLILAALSGLALGLAFDIRYTQVLIAPAVALALWIDARCKMKDERSSFVFYLSSVIICALAALIAALPVLLYHAFAFGSPFHTGSEELTNFSLKRLPETMLRALSELNAYREFGLLTPLLLVGVIVLARQSRQMFAVLAIYVVVSFVFHVSYAYLRLRDILFIFPMLSFFVALGIVELVRWTPTAIRKTRYVIRDTRYGPRIPYSVLRITLICALSFVLVLRSMETLALPVTRGFSAFGYLVPDQRRSFDRLRELTPPNAVIGSSLNSGAIDLYARRLAFHPAAWQPDELTRFVNRLHQDNMPVFLLDDGEELGPTLRTLREHYRVTDFGRVDVPYYFKGSGSENRRVPLLKIEARR